MNNPLEVEHHNQLANPPPPPTKDIVYNKALIKCAPAKTAGPGPPRNQQDHAIVQLVSLYGSKKWTIISQKMQLEYFLQPRTGKQCRQRWYNHLDPHINKSGWTEREERIIFQGHRRYGNKWKEIARDLDGRTDNSVKNQFYSTLRRSLRRINKFLGSKNSTTQMRDIKPSVLARILDLEMIESDSPPQLTSNIRDLPSLLFEFANFKPVKENMLVNSEIMSRDERERFEMVIQKILEINELYDRQKKSKSRNRRKQPHKATRKAARGNVNANTPATSKSMAATQQPDNPVQESEVKIEEQDAEASFEGSELHYNSQKSMSDSNFIHQLKQPSLLGDPHPDLIIIGTPIKLPIAAFGMRSDSLPKDYVESSQQILEINYIS